MITANLSVNGTPTFTSENIKLGSFSLNRYSTSAIAPEFGSVSAGELLFSIDTTTTSASLGRGDIITGTLVEGSTTTSIGEFVVTNLIKGFNELAVTCLDKMILLDGEADLTGITYPITATNFINAIYRDGLHLSVTIDSGVNGAVELDEPFFEMGITYRQVLSKVCECMGANAWYKDGLMIGFYKATQTTITSEDYVIEDTTDDGFTVDVEVTNDFTQKSVEITDNEITLRIVSNPFLANYTQAQREALVATIKSNIGNVTWYGGNVTILPDPALDIMSIVTVETMDETQKAFPITSITYGINENTQLVAKIESADNDYNYSLTREVTGIKNELGGLEIGGVNLLMDTNASSLAKVYAEKNRYWSNASYTGAVGSFITVTDPPSPHIENGIQIAVNNVVAGSGKTLMWYENGEVPLVAGEVYTLSCYARIKSGTQAKLALYYGSVSKALWDVWSQDITSTEWVRVTRTFTANERYMTTSSASIYIGILGNYLSTVEICGFQLEQGSKATAYNRQLDTQTQVEEINNYFWHDNSGAHVSDTPKSTAGRNVLIDSDSVDIKDGSTTLASFGEDVALGGLEYYRTRIDDSRLIIECGEDPNSIYPPGGHPYAYQAVRLSGDNVGTMISGNLMLARVGYNLYCEHEINETTGATTGCTVTEYINDSADVDPLHLEVLQGSTNANSRTIAKSITGGIRFYDRGADIDTLSGETMRLTWDGSIGCVGRDIPASANLNNYRMQGIYTCRQNATAETITNAPTQRAFRLEVTSITKSIGDPNYVVQKVKTYEAEEYVRWAWKNGTTWTWSVWRVLANRLSPTLNWNNTYVTNDRGGMCFVRNNILYMSAWFKTSQQIPQDTVIVSLGGLTRNFSRGYFPIMGVSQIFGQVYTNNNGNSFTTNAILSQSTAYRFINAVLPLIE